MNKVKYGAICFILVMASIGVAAFARLLAFNAGVIYFDRVADHIDWGNTSYLFYIGVAVIVALIGCALLHICSGGRGIAKDILKRKRPGVMAALILISVAVAVLGAFLCDLINPVYSGDNLVVFHFVRLLTIPGIVTALAAAVLWNWIPKIGFME